jgi:hypothetical protein
MSDSSRSGQTQKPIKIINDAPWIGKFQPDGSVELGDCAQREGMFALGQALQADNKYLVSYFNFKLGVLEHPKWKGFYRRSPDSDWTGDWDRMSRDQSTPLVAAMGAMGLYKHLFWHLLSHVLRLGFFTNIRRNGATKENHGKPTPNNKIFNYNIKLPDFAGPSFYALYIRGFGLMALVFYPILCILDIELLAGAIAWRYRKGNDVLNYLVLTRYARHRLPTPISWLGLKLEPKKELWRKLNLYFDETEYQPIKHLWSELI